MAIERTSIDTIFPTHENEEWEIVINEGAFSLKLYQKFGV